MAEPGFFFCRGVEMWRWIETGRGERVRVEVFDFSSCQRCAKVWIMSERQLPMFRFYE
jgi:hypothetical protein